MIHQTSNQCHRRDLSLQVDNDVATHCPSRVAIDFDLAFRQFIFQQLRNFSAGARVRRSVEVLNVDLQLVVLFEEIFDVVRNPANPRDKVFTRFGRRLPDDAIAALELTWFCPPKDLIVQTRLSISKLCQ